MNMHAGKTCGAPLRLGGTCQLPVVANGRCHRHGEVVQESLYVSALGADEQTLFERVAAGGLDEEIRLAKVKLHRYVRLDAETPVVEESGKKSGPNYADLMVRQLDLIRKLELARLALMRGQGDEDDDGLPADGALAADEDMPDSPVM